MKIKIAPYFIHGCVATFETATSRRECDFRRRQCHITKIGTISKNCGRCKSILCHLKQIVTLLWLFCIVDATTWQHRMFLRRGNSGCVLSSLTVHLVKKSASNVHLWHYLFLLLSFLFHSERTKFCKISKPRLHMPWPRRSWTRFLNFLFVQQLISYRRKIIFYLGVNSSYKNYIYRNGIKINSLF